jgi:hypothetical protein
MAVPPYVNPNEIIDESWGDQIANSVVNPFTNAAARTSAIASPTAGMVSALTAADTTNGLYVHNGTSWRLPWNMPWGYLAQTTTPPSSVQTISTTSSTKITGTDTPSVSLFANRRYRATCVGNYEKITAATFAYMVPATSSGTSLGTAWVYRMEIGEAVTISWTTIFTGTTYTGTLQLMAQTLAAGITIQNNVVPARLLIEDMGPAGAPV